MCEGGGRNAQEPWRPRFAAQGGEQVNVLPERQLSAEPWSYNTDQEEDRQDITQWSRKYYYRMLLLYLES